MKTYCLIAIASLLLCSAGKAQVNNGCNKFTLDVQVTGQDPDSIALVLYNNRDIASLKPKVLENGHAIFSGTVVEACDARLWTNLHAQTLDDSSIIRFILEPKAVSIICNVRNMANVKIKGAEAEQQKERWEKENKDLLETKEKLFTTYGTLLKQKRLGETKSLQAQIDSTLNKYVSVSNIIQQRDFCYIQANPGSYLSAFLLSRYTHRAPTDTLVRYYSLLTPNVKKSDLAHTVLKVLYTLTDDWDFKEKNPLIDLKSTQKLENVRTLHDISLLDTAGKQMSFATFKGKYILIDCWGSWCGHCFENITYLDSLIEDMKGRPIAFVSVSLDEDVKIWKDAIRKHKFPGYHLLDKEHLVSTLYKVEWAPRYIIIDPNGNVINRDAPCAKDPELKTILNNLLAEKKK